MTKLVDTTRAVLYKNEYWDRLLDDTIIEKDDRRQDYDAGNELIYTSCRGISARAAMNKWTFVEGYYRRRSPESAPRVDIQSYELEQLRTANAELLAENIRLKALVEDIKKPKPHKVTAYFSDYPINDKNPGIKMELIAVDLTPHPFSYIAAGGHRFRNVANLEVVKYPTPYRT